jgi:hypothetical protein
MKEIPEAPLSQAWPIPRSRVVIANAGIPRSLDCGDASLSVTNSNSFPSGTPPMAKLKGGLWWPLPVLPVLCSTLLLSMGLPRDPVVIEQAEYSCHCWAPPHDMQGLVQMRSTDEVPMFER